MPYADPEKTKQYLRDYGKARRKADPEGIRAYHNAYMRKWKAKNRDKVNAMVKRNHRKDPRGLLIRSSRARAKHAGLEHTLTKEDIVIPRCCPVFGTSFIVGDRNKAPSIDRLDSTKGYTPGNINIISRRANHLKNNSTLRELKALVAWLERQG